MSGDNRSDGDGGGVRLRSLEFRREREATWRRLQELVDKIEARGVRALSADELSRLPALYRATMSSLSVARATSLDRDLLRYLESLCQRAYIAVYGPRRHVWTALSEFFAVRFPAAVYGIRGYVAASLALLLLGAATGFALTMRSPERFYAFVDAAYASGRGPHQSTADMRDDLYDVTSNQGGQLAAFASHLLSHNARIGMLCFALGIAAGIPVAYLLFSNGLLLGAFAALYHDRALGADFWGWVLPHGVTELGAVVLCGAAGLVIGESVVFPGRSTRLANLARRGRAVGPVVLGAVTMFLAAAAIEGLFRQLVQDVLVRYAVIGVSAGFWLWYFAVPRPEWQWYFAETEAG